jgi:hypothetical protein
LDKSDKLVSNAFQIHFSPTREQALSQLINIPDTEEDYFDQVKSDPEFAKYLYTSGGKGFSRKLANVTNVAGNYIQGMLFPHSNVAFDIGEGSER